MEDKQLINISKLTPNNKAIEFVQFLANNNWFGTKPIIIEHSVYLSESDYKKIEHRINFYLENHSKSIDERIKIVSEKYLPPETNKLLQEFTNEKEIDKWTAYHLVDFLSSELPGELLQCDDAEISIILASASTELDKSCRTLLCCFFNWAQTKYKTYYKVSYKATGTYKKNTEAYDEKEWLNMLYLLLNEEHIKKDRMYEKACLYKEYADTWLFLSLHFVCALRSTDLIRIPDPVLNDEPSNIIKKVYNGNFTKEDSITILDSIESKLIYYDFEPNKTKRYSNISNIKLLIPTSCEEHFGKLFAICEAHKLLRYSNPEDYHLIIPARTYKEISKNMGEEIGDLFKYQDFSTRRANKSYLQIIEIMTDKVLGQDTFNMKGYMLASLARSHKGSYGEFAKTTSLYLQDAKMNGLSPEFVARELFERKPLSFVISMMLKIITNNEYNALPVVDQTKLISYTNLSPHEVNTVAGITELSLKRAGKVVAEIFKENINISEVLHNISNCESKGKTSDCLIIASGKMCPFSNKTNCIGCDYEVKTKSTLYVMANELKRLKNEYVKSSNPIEKEKIESMMLHNVLPSINEMYICLKETYGEEEANAFERMIND